MILYMTKSLNFSDAEAYLQYARFLALLFLTPVLGGYVADRFLSTKTAVTIGGGLLSLGYTFLALPQPRFFYVGLGTIIVGGGLFIPNMPAIVGQLYNDSNSRREGAFSIFYTGINLGAFFPPLITGWIILQYGWHASFVMAAAVVFIGTVIFTFVASNAMAKDAQDAESSQARRGGRYLGIIVIAAAFLVILCTSELIKYHAIAQGTLGTAACLLLIYIFRKRATCSKAQRRQLLLCLIFITFSVVYVVLDQQAAMSLTVFTEYNVHRRINNFEIPTVMYQALNPLFVIILGPLLSEMWMSLGKWNLNPSIPVKFGIGTCLMGAAFVLLPIAIGFFSSEGIVASIWIVFNYFLQAFGELMVAPIGLSMIMKLSPPSMVGLMMGTWYFAVAVANTIAGFISWSTTVPDAGNDPILTSAAYAEVFGYLGGIALLAAIVILLFRPRLNDLMQHYS